MQQQTTVFTDSVHSEKRRFKDHLVLTKGQKRESIIIISDRKCERKYRSNTISYGLVRAIPAKDDCRKRYPNPRIRFDRKDAEGRVYIPVINWTAYDNAMFRKAPDLPPCGANTNSSRTLVDIYDAATNNRITDFAHLTPKTI